MGGLIERQVGVNGVPSCVADEAESIQPGVEMAGRKDGIFQTRGCARGRAAAENRRQRQSCV